jgi:hypothetical protein
MKLLNTVRTQLLVVAVLFGLGITTAAKADVCYYDANGITYRGEILATYNTNPTAALVHWVTINDAPVFGQEQKIPFFDLTNCGGQYVQFFPYAYHPWVVGYHLGVTLRFYDRGYYPAGSHRYQSRVVIRNHPQPHPMPRPAPHPMPRPAPHPMPAPRPAPHAPTHEVPSQPGRPDHRPE